MSLYPEYLGDEKKNKCDQAFERIAQALLIKRADFLFGAGMSAASKLPIGHQLAVQLLRKFFPASAPDPVPMEDLERLASAFPFEALAQAIEASRGKKRDDLTADLKEILLDPTYNVSAAHHDFLAISCWDGNPSLNRIFTTNFDLLLEKAFNARGVTITEKNTQEISKALRDEQIPILHLHGVLDEEYQITENDIFKPGFKALMGQFQAALTEADAFVFVGYSMSDPDFRKIYTHYRNEIEVRKRNDKLTYVVSPATDSQYYSLGSALWDSRGALWIPLDAIAFFARLKQVLQSDFDKSVIAKVMKKYNLKDDQAFSDKVDSVCELLCVEKPDAIRFLLEARDKMGGKT